MGKIQDAISKVQRNRAKKFSAGYREHALTAEDDLPLLQDRVDPTPAEATPTARAWDYGGRKIAIARQQLIDGGLLDPDHFRKHLAREYREIKASLLAIVASTDSPAPARGNLILVTSAASGEGRSFICMNVAMSLAADSGYSVVMVDADLCNPRISRMTALQDDPGIADWLRTPSVDVARLICPTDMPGLSVLPAGTDCQALSGSLDGQRIGTLFEELSLADPRRLFIFDSSPLLAASDGQIFAEQVGQVLLVVKAGQTPRQSLADALARVGAARPVNIVLNQVID